MLEFLTNILHNDIVTNWIAPIIGTIVAVLAVRLLLERYKGKSVISIIRLANNRFIDAVRPFFIQEIEINMKIINNIRNAIKREYCADDNMLYTIEQLEEQIILDISETKYLTEERKTELIHNVYDKFDGLKKELPIFSEEEEEQQTQLIRFMIERLRRNNYRLAVLFVLVVMMSIVLLLNYFYTLNFSNLYWLIIILPLIMFIGEMIADNLAQSRSSFLNKYNTSEYQEIKSEIR